MGAILLIESGRGSNEFWSMKDCPIGVKTDLTANPISRSDKTLPDISPKEVDCDGPQTNTVNRIDD